MTFSCLLSRPWLVPYAEDDARRARGVLATFAWRHLNECPRCQAECARLRTTASALQTVSRATASRKSAVQDDLSSTLFAERVMMRVQRDESLRRQLRLRDQRRFTAGLSLSFALAGLGCAFAIYGPPSLAQTWFKNAFHPKPVLVQHSVARRPPFAMHDPFDVAANRAANRSGARSSLRKQHGPSNHSLTPVAQTAGLVRPVVPAVPNPVQDPMDPNSVEEAREAAVTAEEAERERWSQSRAIVVPSPSGARLASSVTPSRTTSQSAPPLLLANAGGNGSGASPALPKASSANYYAPVIASPTPKTSVKPATQDDLRAFGLAPATSPGSAAPSPDPGAPPSETAP